MVKRIHLAPPDWALDAPGLLAAWKGHEERAISRLAAGDLYSALALATPLRASSLLAQVYSDFSAETVGHALMVVWAGTQQPLDELDVQTWTEMFRFAGYVTDELDRPTRPITVYRAANISTQGFGLAWTADIGIARMFYGRRRASGVTVGLYETTVEPAAVLARIEHRRENEVIVDATIIENIECLEIGEPTRLEDIGLGYPFTNR